VSANHSQNHFAYTNSASFRIGECYWFDRDLENLDKCSRIARSGEPDGPSV
jgi:hypothetical protein